MINCTLWKSTGRMRRYLYVYVTGEGIQWLVDCQGKESHTALKLLDELPVQLDEHGCFPYWETSEVAPEGWPAECDKCGVRFNSFCLRSDERWKLHYSITPRIILTDGKEEKTIPDLPVGAMWLCSEGVGGSDYWRNRGGGPHLMVRTPGGDWDVDRPSSGGPGWQRSGEPPNVTATPSVFHDPPNGWHGFLENGILRPA